MTPKERAENSRAYTVHLAPAARVILAAVPCSISVNGKGQDIACDLVFTTNGRMAVSGFSRPRITFNEQGQEAHAKAAAAAGVEPPAPLPTSRFHDFQLTAVM